MALTTVFIFIALLGVLIFVHELGHFLVAKMCRVGVLEFAIGFGRQIFKKRIGETTYSIRWIPLGGFVKMVGEDPRMRADPEPLEESEAEAVQAQQEMELSPEEINLLNDRSRWFIEKGYLAKTAIVLAGPGFNVLFAILVSIGTFYILGRPVRQAPDRPIIGTTLPDSPGEQSGLQAKDLVTEINGEKINTWTELSSRIASSNGAPLHLKVERTVEKNGVESTEVRMITVTPKKMKSEEQEIWEGREIEPSYKVGIQVYIPREPVSGLGEAIYLGTRNVADASTFMALSIWGMVKGNVSTENLGGPISIFQATAHSTKRGIEYILGLIVLLNISLAIINLMPIPILDGGHLMFFTIEGIKGSPVSLRVIERANQVGMFILLLLMVVALRNDLLRLF
ncbi:MAG: site-2 protease family protein [Deltaproteobacteria bacterium]|nr:site-2 protease family protein [Deltaproteobacteria bacterium]